MYNWGIRAIGVPNKSTKQTGDFWIYLIIYSMQVVIVSAWNPSQDPTGQLVDPHRNTGSPTSLGITFSHWHNSRKSDSNPKVKQHSLKYSQYTNLESVIFISLCSAFMRDSKISDKCSTYKDTKVLQVLAITLNKCLICITQSPAEAGQDFEPTL